MEIKFSENQKFLCSDKEKIFEVKTSSQQFVSKIPKERKFKVENLFEFKRITGDLTLSIIFLFFVGFLLVHFNYSSKKVSFLKLFDPTGDIEKDLKEMKAYFNRAS